MNQFKLVCLGLITIMSSGCQVISPLFIDYNGVRMDVAKWINNHQLLSMQQKRSLVQLSKAQQKLYQIQNKSEEQRIQIIKENMKSNETKDYNEQEYDQSLIMYPERDSVVRIDNYMISGPKIKKMHLKHKYRGTTK